MNLSRRNLLLIGLLIADVLLLLTRENAPQEQFVLLGVCAVIIFFLRGEIAVRWREFFAIHKTLHGPTLSGTVVLTCNIVDEERGVHCTNSADYILTTEVARPGEPDAQPPTGKIFCCKDHHPNRNAKRGIGRLSYQTDALLGAKNVQWGEVIKIDREEKTPLGLGG